MSSKEGPILPTFHQKPIPFIKVFRKHLPLICISVLLTLSLLCYVFVPQIRDTTRSFTNYQNQWSSLTSGLSSGSVSATSRSNSNVYSSPNHAINGYNNFSTNYSHLQRIQINGQPLTLPSGEDPNSTVNAQRQFVKEMLKHSWDSYVKYGWGHNELKPLSRVGHTSEIFGGDHLLGATIVDSLSTLYIMNMTEEFERGRNWVQNNLDLSLVNSEMSVFETVIRFVGGLLSAFAFTNDQMFLQKAKHVADRMLPAFETTTGKESHNFCQNSC